MALEYHLPSLVMGGIVGLLVGALAAIAFSQPRVARAIGKTAAVVLIAAGAGLLCWGLLTTIGVGEFEALEFGPITLYSATQTLGWGAGLLAGGITALVLALVGRS